MIRVSSALWCLSIVLASCGGKAKLTNEQKMELTTLLESTGRSQRAAQALSYQKMRVNDEQLDTSSPSGKSDEAVQLMSQKLSAASCDRTQFIPETDSGSLITKPSKKGYVVEGPSCPVSYHFVVTTDETQKDRTNVHVDLHYAVADESFKALNDVSGYSLTGDIRGSGNDANGSFRGSIQSQALGNIPLEIDLNVSTLGGELSLRWEFPNFSVEMKAAGRGGKIDYSLNGEAITSTQFLQTLAKAGPAFSQFIQLNSGSTSGTSTTVSEDVPAPESSVQPPPP